MFVPGFAVGVLAWNTEVVQDQFSYGRIDPKMRANGNAQDTILGYVSAVVAVRAIRHKPRPIYGEEPERDQSE